MTDVFTKQKRSQIMSKIKGRDTKPELLVRSMLHRMGYRFRLHVESMTGKPDIVLPRYGKLIFVNGCFWHGHKACSKGSTPKSNKEFWEKKISTNICRDRSVRRQLHKQGWTVLTIWECQTRNLESLSLILNKFMKL